jgi:WD40 repeat protein
MKIKSPPSDLVSSLEFSDFLLCSSWNSSVSLYDTSSNRVLFSSTLSSPALSSRFLGEDQFVSGDLDGRVHLTTFKGDKILFDVGTPRTARVKERRSASFYHSSLSSVKTIDIHEGQIIAGTWNKKLVSYDLRAGEVTRSIPLSGRVVCSSLQGHTLALALGDDTVELLDLRSYAVVESRKSAIEDSRICSVLLAEGVEGRALFYSSTSGKTCVSHLEDASSEKSYVFKSHRAQLGGMEMFFPVTALGMSSEGDLLTGGFDGNVYAWDIAKKRQVKRIFGGEKPVTHIAVRRDQTGRVGREVAIGTGDICKRADGEEKENFVPISGIETTQDSLYKEEPCEIHIACQ